MIRTRAERGFTLIEILIAVVVISVLAAVALPSFMSSIRKSRRSEAFTLLSAVQLAQERWRSNNTAYTTVLANTAVSPAPANGLGQPSSTPSNYYTISVTAASANGYTVLASPASGGSQTSDIDCAYLIVRVDLGNIYYGSGQSVGSITDSAAGNRCWSR